MTDPFATVSPDDPPRPAFPRSRWDRLTGLWVSRSWSFTRIGVTALVLTGVVAMGSFLLRTPAAPIESQLPMASDTPGSTGASGSGGRDPSGDPGSTPLPPPSDGAGGGDGEEPEDLTVHAAGAVVRPGVYRLPATARVVDLVNIAGGFAPDADPDRLNLAALLTDGARIWVPKRGEQQPPEAVNGDGGTAAGPATGGDGAANPSSPLDLNTATAAELDTLPGVGPATAEAIIEHRTRNGPFQAVDELIDVRGIGEAKLADLRDRVRV